MSRSHGRRASPLPAAFDRPLQLAQRGADLGAAPDSSRIAPVIPFLGHRDGGQAVAVRAGRVISAAEFLGDVQTLASQLPSRSHAINLCRDRYCFAVALAAAMARGQVSLLPASQALESLRELQRVYGSACLLVDDGAVRDTQSVRVAVGNGAVAAAPQALAFAADTVAAIAFTSGSTGAPVPNVKTWGGLARGGDSEVQRFGLLDGSASVIVATVPPQHMYGLESTVIMPLRGGLIMHSERPFFPADVQSVLHSVDAERVLVSTPVHLRALLASGIDLPALRQVICATAPLSVDLAKRFESRYQVEVHEVYGFTEAGMVATRRTLDGPAWRLLDGLRMRKAGQRIWVSGGHVPSEVAASDVIDPIDEEYFLLRGRDSDLVNIAGKRTSIAYLDHQLCGIAGVQDGAFFLPELAGEAVTRLIAFAVAPGMTREQLLEALAQRIDPVFLPRPLNLVDALPRNSTGKLPRSALIKLAQQHAGDRAPQPVRVSRVINPAHPALAGHFPGNPVVPGVVLLDEIVEAAAAQLGITQPGITQFGITQFGINGGAAALVIRSAKFSRAVRPGDCLHISLTAGDNETVRFVCTVGDATAVSGLLGYARPEQ